MLAYVCHKEILSLRTQSFPHHTVVDTCTFNRQVICL